MTKKLTDSDKNVWGLFSSKDAKGRVYVRAYRNEWDAEKKRSRVKSRLQAGRLLEDGSVNMSDEFRKKFPELGDKAWYWGDNTLLSEKEFRDTYEPKDGPKDLTWSCETIRVGSTLAAWETAKTLGILDDLSLVFDKETAKALLAFAIYKFDGGGAMMTFEDWLAQVWLPGVLPLNGRRISEILSKVTPELMEDYYKLRFNRAKKNNPKGMTLSFDSTSISTYSTTITDAAWGHAKQNPDLKQVNYLVVCAHDSGDVVYAFTFDGSVNDKTILATAYLQMKSAGIELADNILVTDRGFSSIYNTQRAINLELKFIQFLPLTEDSVFAHLARKMKALCDPIAHVNPEMGISAIKLQEDWQADIGGTSVPVTSFLFLYRNPIVATEETLALHRDVLRVCELKNKEANQEKKTRIDEALWKRVKNCLSENKRAKEGEPVWAINFEKLQKNVRFFGCQAIRSNVDKNPFEILRIYRQRLIIEQGFNQLKNEVGGSRLEATESTYRGKLFIFSLAQALRMSMLVTASKKRKNNPKAKLPDDSLRKTIVQLQGLQARKHRTTDAFILGTVPKRYRDLLALIGIEKLPKTLYR